MEAPIWRESYQDQAESVFDQCLLGAGIGTVGHHLQKPASSRHQTAGWEGSSLRFDGVHGNLNKKVKCILILNFEFISTVHGEPTNRGSQDNVEREVVWCDQKYLQQGRQEEADSGWGNEAQNAEEVFQFSGYAYDSTTAELVCQQRKGLYQLHLRCRGMKSHCASVHKI